ncbi:MAG: lipocalin-like domain-containing protein [Chitinophagaceae bacterium]|nr:lipocalin-like domain-containing protein [Chitinophagaceae bacterium]
MKQVNWLFAIVVIGFLTACETNKTAQANPLIGTWQLQTGTLVEKGDTTITDYTTGKKFIKVINGSHFTFLSHDLNKVADSTSYFSAGGGSYKLKDSTYTEHLEFCSDRAWEGHDFPFTITISGDTLVQRGVEIVESKGINRLNIERYVRIKE